jgi:hypothetical protein
VSETRELLGVYDADGGLRGEVSYVVGKLLGRRHCSLCDLTHSPLRRKPEWDALVAELGVPFRLAHRNELTEEEREAVRRVGAPAVLDVADGRVEPLLGPGDLEPLEGDLARFGVLLREALAS